jgi:hypothetical protein
LGLRKASCDDGITNISEEEIALDISEGVFYWTCNFTLSPKKLSHLPTANLKITTTIYDFGNQQVLSRPSLSSYCTQ